MTCGQLPWHKNHMASHHVWSCDHRQWWTALDIKASSWWGGWWGGGFFITIGNLSIHLRLHISVSKGFLQHVSISRFDSLVVVILLLHNLETKFPVKIDRSFIVHLNMSEKDNIYLKTIFRQLYFKFSIYCYIFAFYTERQFAVQLAYEFLTKVE